MLIQEQFITEMLQSCVKLASHEVSFRIVSNKHVRLNKCTPNFWIWLAISEKLLNRSESYFLHLNLRNMGVHILSFIETRQGPASLLHVFIQRNMVIKLIGCFEISKFAFITGVCCFRVTAHCLVLLRTSNWRRKGEVTRWEWSRILGITCDGYRSEVDNNIAAIVGRG